MIGTVSVKYALRSLFRHTRRTILSVVGIGIGCSIALFTTSYVRGGAEMQIRAASESGAGHVRVAPAGWLETRENTLRLVEWEKVLAEVKVLPAFKTAAVRARANGLLAFGSRTAGVEVVGVDPEAEKEANRIVRRSRIEGRYLEPGDSGSVVIGKALAKRLDVELDDDLYVTLAGAEDIHSAMLQIIGIMDIGSKDLESVTCHVTLQDIERITGYKGPAEISVLLNDHKLIDATRKALAEKLPEGNVVITWKEVSPDLAANVEGDTAFMSMIIFIIVVVVALGIVGAQLTAVLERRRELAILTALGMKGRQVAAVIMLEGVLVGVCGAVVALLLGGSAAYYIATRGIYIAALLGGELSFGNALFDPYIYGDFGIWVVWYALGVSVVATVAASIYPAWFAVKTNPASALRVEQ